jgi:predicted neuraminidase
MRLFCGLIMLSSVLAVPAVHAQTSSEPEIRDLFAMQELHVHGPTIEELPNGDLLAAWFEGTGERWADDVVIMGARLRAGEDTWSEPFLMADVPDFPDINPVLFLDNDTRLWLMWYTVIANQWETSLLRYRISTQYDAPGAPLWEWQDVLLVKPGSLAERGIQPGDRFVESVTRQLDAMVASGSGDDSERLQAYAERILHRAAGQDYVRAGRERQPDGSIIEKPLGYPYFRRMGWQTKNKPLILETGRIIVPLYSDGFSFSLMAITDNGGKNWFFSEPLVAPGAIQPALARRADGTIVAYMRDNGPPPKRLHMSMSSDDGVTWSNVRDSDRVNSGTGADIVTLANGNWLLVNNDTETGRTRLAVSVSDDGGETWRWNRNLEEHEVARSHYPGVIQTQDGRIHVIYSYHTRGADDGEAKTIRHAVFDESWVRN